MSEVAAKPRLEQQLCFAIYSAMHAVTKAYQPLLGKLGLTHPQYLAMLVLWETGDVTVKQMGERLFLDSGTLMPLLKRLEGMGLLNRGRDPKDERRVRLNLTENGKTLHRDALPVPGQIAAAMGRPPEDLKTVINQNFAADNVTVTGRLCDSVSADGACPATTIIRNDGSFPVAVRVLEHLLRDLEQHHELVDCKVGEVHP
jgi:DNA-binding MarR family transcriptional regulator